MEMPMDTSANINSLGEQTLITQNLRASHEIIARFEKSKDNMEILLDKLPDIFIVFDSTGRILKGNHKAAKLFNVSIERVIWKNISQFFNKESWHIFENNYKSLTSGEYDEVEFELNLDGIDPDNVLDYHWHIQRVPGISDRRGALFNVIGRDISKVKEYEKKLSQIFSTIPIGILTIDKSGKVMGPYSAYCEYLLDDTSLEEKSIDKLLFESCYKNMSRSDKLGIEELFSTFDKEDLWFELCKDRFPKELIFTPNGKKENRVLGITYHPILSDNRIRNMLFILEDKTGISNVKLDEQSKKFQENRRINRIIDVHRCDRQTMLSTLNDLEKAIQRFRIANEVYDLAKLGNIVLSIKNIAKIAGLRNLINIANEIEGIIQGENKDSEETTKNKLNQLNQLITYEWEEILNLNKMIHRNIKEHKELSIHKDFNKRKAAIELELYSIKATLEDLRGQGNADLLTSINQKVDQICEGVRHINAFKLGEIEDMLRERAKINAQQVNKKVVINFDWANIMVDEEFLPKLSKILLHFVNNTVDYSIEESNARVALKKEATANISIKVNKVGEYLQFVYNDDGYGFDVEEVGRIAVNRNIIGREELKELSKNEVLNLVFSNGFSTGGEIESASGRAFELNMALCLIRECGSDSIKITQSDDEGNRYEFKIKAY